MGRICFLVLLFGLGQAEAFQMSEDQLAAAEIQQQRAKVHDFFARQERLRDLERKRLSARGQHLERRSRELAMEESARQEYVQKRQQRGPDRSEQLELAWEERHRAELAREDEIRQAYAIKRDRREQMLAREPQIDEMLEYELK